MSESVERYNDYLCCILIEGYLRKKIGHPVIFPYDICNIIIKHIQLPFAYLSSIQGPKFHQHKLKYILFAYSLDISQFDDKELIWLTLRQLAFNRDSLGSDKVILWRILDETKYRHRDKNKKLLHALNVCSYSGAHYQSPIKVEKTKFAEKTCGFSEHPDYGQYNKYLDIVIDLGKKGMGLRCKYMSKLIQLYEYYYFDLYVLKYIKSMNKNIPKQFMQGIQENMHYHMDRLLGDRKYNKFNVDLNEWNNSKSMKMGKLLQIIGRKYLAKYDELMEEMEVMLDFVRMKYEIVKFRLNELFEAEKLAYETLVEDGRLEEAFDDTK